jgi:pilus assembly protein Flp/PilA
MPDSFRPAEAGEKIRKEKKMNNLFLAMYVKLNNLMKHEEGQDLIEYALIAALIAVATIAGMSQVATAVNGLFSNISSSLA